MVKCADCGYLAVRNRKTHSLDEAGSDFRDKGAVAQGYDDIGNNPHPLHEPIPLCFARYHYLGDAIKKIKQKSNPFEEVKTIIQTDIDCKEFTKWQQGFTPKEHGEENMEGKRRKSDRVWHFVELAITLGVGAIIALISAYINKG